MHGYASDYVRHGPRHRLGSRYDGSYTEGPYPWGAGALYGRRGYADGGYDSGYRQGPRLSRGRYDVGWSPTFGTGDGDPGGPYTRRGRGVPGPGYFRDDLRRRSRNRAAYDRGYADRFRRVPEGAELKEFRPEELGHLWDR